MCTKHSLAHWMGEDGRKNQINQMSKSCTNHHQKKMNKHTNPFFIIIVLLLHYAPVNKNHSKKIEFLKRLTSWFHGLRSVIFFLCFGRCLKNVNIICEWRHYNHTIIVISYIKYTIHISIHVIFYFFFFFVLWFSFGYS